MRIARFAVTFVGALLFFVPFTTAQVKTFGAHLAGKNEVPASSSATGGATFHLTNDGKTLTYTLSISDIEDITMPMSILASQAV